MNKVSSDKKFLLKILWLFTVLGLIIFWPILSGKVNLNGNLLVSFYAPYDENLPYKNSGWDQLRIYFPFYNVTLDSIRNLEIPLWNPYAFSGHPHLADFQTAVFYPLNIFSIFLSQIEFWHFLRITPMILASFFTFLYLRSLKLSVLANFFGAITFGFSPFILTWGEEVVMSPHSIVWLPLILWALERFFAHSTSLGTQNDRKKYLAIIAFATASSFFGGYMQTSIYMFIFVFFYLVFRIWQFGNFQSRLVYVFQAGIGVLMGIGIAAVQLLPSAELFFNAARSEIALREQLFNFLLPLESVLTYLASDFFGHPKTANFFRFNDAQYYEGILFVGVATLVFASYMLIKEEKRGLIRFLAISGLVALSTTIDLPTSKLLMSLPIPFLSTSIPNRVLFIPVFCLAVLAAAGLDRWLKNKFEIRPFDFAQGENSKFEILEAILIIAGLYCGILATLGIVKFFGLSYFEHKQFLTETNLLVTLRNLLIPIVVFATTAILIATAVLQRLEKRVAAILIIAISFLHIFYFSQKYFSFSDRKYIFPKNSVLEFIKQNQEISRSWGVGEAFLENNFASQYGIYYPEGYDSLNNRSYAQFTYAMQGNKIPDFVFRADAGLGRGETEELVANQNRRRLIDMVGVKYLIAQDLDSEILERHNFVKVFESEDGQYAVFENPQAMPRAFLASNYEGPPPYEEPYRTTKEIDKIRRKMIFEKLLTSDFDFRNVLILEKPSPISPQFGEGLAKIISYQPQEVVIKTKSDQPKLLFLSDNYYPGWKATVDGDEVAILRANYTFRAVPLVPGEHEVRFYYDSKVFKVGAVISTLSLSILAFLSFNRLKFLKL